MFPSPLTVINCRKSRVKKFVSTLIFYHTLKKIVFFFKKFQNFEKKSSTSTYNQLKSKRERERERERERDSHTHKHKTHTFTLKNMMENKFSEKDVELRLKLALWGRRYDDLEIHKIKNKHLRVRSIENRNTKTNRVVITWTRSRNPRRRLREKAFEIEPEGKSFSVSSPNSSDLSRTTEEFSWMMMMM